jgi:hypothetical protein
VLCAQVSVADFGLDHFNPACSSGTDTPESSKFGDCSTRVEVTSTSEGSTSYRFVGLVSMSSGELDSACGFDLHSKALNNSDLDLGRLVSPRMWRDRVQEH